MKVSNVLLAMACVLTVMVAAQPAKAQFITPAEREAYRVNWEKMQQSKPKKDQGQPAKAKPANDNKKPAARPQQKRKAPNKRVKVSPRGNYAQQTADFNKALEKAVVQSAKNA